LQEFSPVNAATLFAEERPFKMNTEDFRARLIRFVLC
jgi:hypothetical protein